MIGLLIRLLRKHEGPCQLEEIFPGWEVERQREIAIEWKSIRPQ